VTIYTPRVLKWLQENMSCRRFAKHVANGEELLQGPYRRFHFYLHWAVCPFCRRYWNEIKRIGAAQKALSDLTHHPAVKLIQIKSRLQEKLNRKYA
jgi:hypothetical protein